MEIKTVNPELLKKCLHGGTQNPNEIVDIVIWSRVPPEENISINRSIILLGSYDANSSVNMGNVSKLEILRKFNIEPGDCTAQAMERLNKPTLLNAKYSCLQKNKGS
ncbi:uncharacterized protein TNCV_3021641 [Trichonephila clavipes]|nr:uncharacterized protein TNCV_3021641 [Trichonephila clavipes]